MASAKSPGVTPGGSFIPGSCCLSKSAALRNFGGAGIALLRSRLAHGFWPDAAFPRRQNPVRIERILHRLVKTKQSVIVVGIDVRHVVHVRNVGAILPPPVLGGHLNQASENLAALLIRFHVVHDRETKQKNESSGEKRPRKRDELVLRRHFQLVVYFAK